MNTREVLRLVVGSVAVYVIVAACSANEGIAPSTVKNGSTATGGATNADGGTSSNGGSLLIAITNPVSDAAAQSATSGSRLKANYYVGTDGSKQFISWHDSQLGVDCSFALASDGTTRCMPVEYNALTGIYFSDSACSQTLAIINKGCSAPKYAYGGVSSCSSYSYIIYQPGSAYTGTLYSGTPSSCSATTSSSSSYGFYSATVVPPSTFVQATVQTDS